MTLSMTVATIALAPCVNAQTPLPEGTFVSETALFEREYPRVDKANRVWFPLCSQSSGRKGQLQRFH